MQNTFTPSSAGSRPEDRIEVSLRSISQNIIAVVFGLLPLFFIPVLYAPFDYTKTLFVIIGVLVAIIFFSLSILRSGRLKIAAPIAIWGLWAVAGSALISGLLSGDMNDAFIGDTFGVHTALFLTLLALLATVTSVIGQSKSSVMRLYLLLTVSAGVLTLFHVSRLLFGADFLSLGIFNSVVSSPVGGWNDLGLLFGLIILLALVALEQLPLTKWGRVMFSVTVGLSLLMLAVVNFFAVWIVLALVSLVVLMYSLTKDRFASQSMSPETTPTISLLSIVLSASVFIVSLLFIIGGSSIGAFVSNLTNISYIEVRPSVEATVDIARNVYSENAFVGIGPNRFNDAWRLYKDPSINQTIFWSTDFASGSGYIPSFFVTTGIFGAIAWIIFFLLLLRAGYRMLFGAQSGDKFWHFIGSSSFVAAAYLWGMSFVYVPGTTILLLAGIFTSIVFVAYASIVQPKGLALSVASNKRSGIILVGIVMLVIVASASALYFTGRHYSAVYSFSEAVNSIAEGTDIETIEARIAEAYNTSQNDIYARQIAQYQIAKMNALLGVAEPTAEQQQQFQAAATNGINAAQLAINSDYTEPLNHTTLGAIYSILAATGVEGAKDLAQESFNRASEFDPSNPTYPLLEAQLDSRTGDLESARTAVIEAVQLKSNYTDALFFLTQLDIAAGNVEEAIVTTSAMVSLEPNNPARVYQLGILHTSAGNLEQAISAFERAVALDTNYANARYFLALAYVEADRVDDAIAQLEVVRDLNPDNAGIQELITQLESGATISVPTGFESPVTEPAPVTGSDNAVTSTEDPDTPLVTPVNIVPDSDTDTEAVTTDSTTETTGTTTSEESDETTQ